LQCPFSYFVSFVVVGRTPPSCEWQDKLLEMEVEKGPKTLLAGVGDKGNSPNGPPDGSTKKALLNMHGTLGFFSSTL
jgi:hypothetical protein